MFWVLGMWPTPLNFGPDELWECIQIFYCSPYPRIWIDGQIQYNLTYMRNRRAKLIETESGMSVSGARGRGKWRDDKSSNYAK